jgi:hypothetical protein
MRAVSRLVVLSAVSSFVALGTGCGELLTPAKVREHLENPTAAASDTTMTRTARDYFSAQRASSAQALAFFTKTDLGDSSSDTNNAAAFAVANTALDRALINAAAGDVSVNDSFCAGTFTAQLIAFDDCDVGTDCDVELTVDSCLLRVGEGADENAKGRIVFKLKSVSSETSGEAFARTELRLTFEDFEFTDGDEMQYLDGLLAVETTEFENVEIESERVEVILAADVTQQRRRIERGILFDDGRLSTTRATAGLRFTAADEATSASVNVELLAFVDEDDNARDESLVFSFGAEAREVSADQSIAGATLEVRGENGEFRCTWSAASEEQGADRTTVESEGECVDEDGEVFAFSGTVNGR